MVSLVDIGPSIGTVLIRGQLIDINGLTAEHIVKLFVAHPELRKLFANRADAEVIQTLFNDMPQTIGVIIAAGTGHQDDKDHIVAARQLSLGEQWSLLEGILTITFPQTVKSFLDGLLALMQQSGGPGWAPGTTLPAPSKGASPQADQNKTAGDQPQDSSAAGSN